MSRRDGILLALTVLVLALPPLLTGAGFEGSDDRARDMVSEIDPAYRPWAGNLFDPEGMETALFGLQAALGAAVLGYAIARRRKADGGA